jgi:hypothetical protein
MRRLAVLVAAGLTVAAAAGCTSPSTPHASNHREPLRSVVLEHEQCTAAQLSASGGRQGGGFRTAHGDIDLRSVAPPECDLAPPTAITLVNAHGKALDVRYLLDSASGSALAASSLGPGDVTDLAVGWSNWCASDPGPLHIRITWSNGGTTSSPFNGPPDYDYVPGCVNSKQPSTLQFIGYIWTRRSGQ